MNLFEPGPVWVTSEVSDLMAKNPDFDRAAMTRSAGICRALGVIFPKVTVI